MRTIEERREYDRIRKSKWLKNNPEKREKNRLKNIEWRKHNREKCCRATANWRTKNPEYESGRKLKERYNITPEKYEEMLTFQSKRCAICGNEETARHNRSNEVQKLAVDHCHVTGKVRGLLCQDCNRGIAKFHDDPFRLTNAIKYLKHHSS
jgi:hypothetical protein